MADILRPASPAKQARVTVGDLDLALLPQTDLVSIGPFRGQADAVSATVKAALGVSLSSGFQEQDSPEGYAVFRAEHSQWFCRGPEGGMLEARLVALCEGRAAVTDQSDSRVRFSLCGPGAAAIAAKLVPVDLRASAFAKDCVALTLAGHIPVILTCREVLLEYEFLVPRSLAQSLFDDIHIAMKGGIPGSDPVCSRADKGDYFIPSGEMDPRDDRNARA